MANAMAWKRRLEARLGGETLIELVETIFVDKPKSMRLGLFGLTAERIVFYRKKFIGEEFLSYPRTGARLEESATDELTGLINQAGGDARSLIVTAADGSTLRLPGLSSGDSSRLMAAFAG